MLDIALIFIAITLLLAGFSVLKRSLKVVSYVPVEARVMHSEVQAFTRREVYVDVQYYKPAMTYVYSVGERTYESSVVFPKDKYIMFAERVRASALASKLERASLAYVDPADPAAAVLYRPSKTAILLKDGGLFAAGVVLSITYAVVRTYT